MKINRQHLLDDLTGFALAGSGMVVGKPGIGKSYILRQLIKKLNECGILCILIKIDNLSDGSDDAIKKELKQEDDWVSTLNQVKIEDQKAILIFDAFDAARDEKFRKQMLGHIRRAKSELSEKWNIIVSVRTYDAFKSPELMRLFPSGVPDDEIVSCRKIEVRELGSDEIDSAMKNNSRLSNFFKESSPELKEILRVPFFLILAEKVISFNDGSYIDEVKKYKSEIQLLNKYWENKLVHIDHNTSVELILRNLVKILVTDRSLSCSKQSFLDANPQIEASSLEYLRSEDVLEDISVNKNRIAFSHNILFDYAVSRYSMTDKYEEFLNFVKEDLTRPFFLRPSFLYFFTSLWYNDRSVFWEFYWKVDSEPNKEITLFHRLVLCGIAASEYGTVEDLEPIINLQNREKRVITIRNLLQSMRFMKNAGSSSESAFLYRLSMQLDEIYLFEFAFLLDEFIKKHGTSIHLEYSGLSARNLLNYILDNRMRGNKQFLDRIGSTRGVELVAKTYPSDKTASKHVLTKVLDLLSEPDFEIWYFSNLSENVKNILSQDDIFVAEIFRRIFEHDETDNKRTQMGGSVIMNFTSTRMQDFEMCHFRLEQLFPAFMKQAPRLALPVGLKIANDYVIKDRQRFYEQMDRIEFTYDGITCSYMMDLSSIWSESIHYHKPADLINKILEYIETELEQNADEAKFLLTEYIKNALVGYSWKQLFSFASRHPAKLTDFIYPLLITPTFLAGVDTSYEVRECIERCTPFLTAKQIEKIEEAIWGSYSEEKDYTIRQALSRIPFELLQLERSRIFMEAGGTTENVPGIKSYSSSETYTTDMWLTDQGINVEDPTNKGLLNKSKMLDAYNHQWMNYEPPIDAVREVLPTALSLVDVVRTSGTNLPKELSQSVLTEALKTISTATKIIDQLTKEEAENVIACVKYGFTIISDADQGDQFNTSPSRGWSSTPRNESADALLHLYLYDRSEENWQAFENGVSDSNAVVRYHAVKRIVLLADSQYEKYWSLITDRLNREEDSFIYAMLIGNLKFIPENIETQGPQIITLIEQKEDKFLPNTTFTEHYLDLLLWLMSRHKIKMASKKLWNAYDNPSFCRNIIFKMFERMHPSFPDNDYINDPSLYKLQIDIVLHYAERANNDLKEIFSHEILQDDPRLKDVFSILDEIILRIYFQLESKRLGNSGHRLPINFENRKHFYFRIKPIYEKIIGLSESIPNGGMITGHTAHYFIQSLNEMLSDDPEEILGMITKITTLSLASHYTFDSFAIQQMVALTEKLLADHRDILLKDENFRNLIQLLDIYINSGWVDALELLWKLDEVFK